MKWSGASLIDWADEGVNPPIGNTWTVVDGIINAEGKIQIYFDKDDGSGESVANALHNDLKPVLLSA